MKFSLLGGNIHGPALFMDNPQCLSDLIGSSILSTGSITFQIASSKAPQHRTPTTARLYLVYLIIARASEDFILKVSGRSSKASPRLSRRLGLLYRPPDAPLKLYLASSKQPRRAYNVGVTRRSVTSKFSLIWQGKLFISSKLLVIIEHSPPPETWLLNNLKRHSLALASLLRTVARIRSRITWLREGDANTRLF